MLEHKQARHTVQFAMLEWSRNSDGNSVLTRPLFVYLSLLAGKGKELWAGFCEI